MSKLLVVLFRLYLVQYDLNPEKLLPADMNVDSSKAAAAAKKLKSYYFGWIPVSLSNMELMRVVIVFYILLLLLK